MSAAPTKVPAGAGAVLEVLVRQAAGRLLAAVGDPVARVLTARPDLDVYAEYERMRARGPVLRSRTGLAVLTSYAHCDRVLRDPRFVVRDAQGRSAGTDRLTGAAYGPMDGSFLTLDPPEHTRLRRLAAPALRPPVVRDYAGAIRATATALLDRVAGRDSFDLMADFAAPLPIAVISDLLGIPDVDTARFRRIGLVVAQALDGVRTPRQAARLWAASNELADLVTRLAAARRADPRDDVVSALAASQADDQLTAAELVAMCGLMLVAGFETTVNLIGNGTAALLADRTHWSALVADPSLAGAVVAETLRHDPPVQATERVTGEEVDLDGARLRPWTPVLVVIAAANRDPAVYRDPARFDPHRVGEPASLAFGAGIHYCLGAPLARLEGEIAFAALAERLPHLRALPGRRRRAGSIIRGYRTFPVAPSG